MAETLKRFVEIPFSKFINNLVPLRREDIEPDLSGGFDIDDAHTESLCHTFVQDLNRRSICPNYTISHGRIAVDPRHNIPDRIDGGLYLSAEAPADRKQDWRHERLSLTWISQEDEDPFQDFHDPLDQFDVSRGIRTHLISTATEVFVRQQRCFHFTVFIFGHFARLIRWDRSGAVVTQKLNYKDHPRMLRRFLWRYCRLTEEHQGHDSSAIRIEPGTEEYTLMDWAAKNGSDRPCSLQPWDMLDEPCLLTNDERMDYARSTFEASLSEGWPRWKLPVCEEGPTGRQTTRWFLVCKPDAYNPDLFTRGTRGYVALDCETKRFVFLKDVWGLDTRHTAGRREGETLRMLASQSVRNIPTVLCHGDVLGQRTATYGFQKWMRKLGQPDEMTKELFHYRLVEHEVGRPLALFEKSKDLLIIFLDCLHAHEDAVTKFNILHRDISIGNMLIVYRAGEHGDASPHGLLIDWELSLPLSEGAEKHNGKQRVGTWRFISAHSQNDPYRPLNIQDDLESFFHVLLYCAIRWLPSNCPDVSVFVKSFFDACRFSCGEYVGSAAKYQGMGTGHIRVMSNGFSVDLQFACRGSRQRHPVDDIITELLRWFGAYYSPHPALCPDPEPVDDASSDTMVAPSENLFFDSDEEFSEDLEFEALKASYQDPVSLAQIESSRRAAALLESHQGMCDLISKVSRRHGWPSNDRIPDRIKYPDPVVAPLVGSDSTARPRPVKSAEPKPAEAPHCSAERRTENTVVPVDLDIVPPAKRAPTDIEDKPRRAKRTKRARFVAGSSAPGTAVCIDAASAPRAPSKRPNAPDANPRPSKRAKQISPSNLPKLSTRPSPRPESVDTSAASATRRSGHMVLRSRPNPTKRFGF